MKRLVRKKQPNLLSPVRPNVGIEFEYRRKLDALVREMHDSVVYWVKASYRKNEPVIVAIDELPAASLRKVMRELSRRWQRNFDRGAQELAEYFTRSAADRSDKALKAILKRAGYTVKLQLSRAVQDVLRASINENVTLIKSVASQYLMQVEGSVMRSVQTGRDLASLTNEIESHYGVSRRRAAFIARDQNNKATAVITRVRQQEVGITEAIWMHSLGGKTPRPSHLKAGRERQRYDVRKGWFDPAEQKYIWPGELINCRCVSRSVIPGLS